MKSRFVLLACLLVASLSISRAEDAPETTLKVHAVEFLKPLPAAIAPKLEAQGIKLKATSGGGTAEAVAMVGTSLADFAFTLRPVSGEDQAAYPEKSFESIEIGKLAIAFIVPGILWENGVKSLTREQAAEIYESKLTNWNQLGGPNRSIKFFNPAQGRGIWETFAAWLYGDTAKAAAGRFESVPDGENASATVQFNSGGLSLAAFRWANRKEVFPLGINEGGTIIEPTPENVASGKYPLSKTVYVVFPGKILGARRRVLDFLTGPDGQNILRQSDIIPIGDLPGRKMTKPE